ncbi:hypothetical protein H112_04905 [Trichophyton rubrum D6]|uniref:Cytochrome P450 n=3 Tax=Trichophyton TaxID=5550 RepID=A0A080WJL9_TRIRC|nr:uncharacterized protein TERG_04682 [Trichophyton rubrum CBS 118892]EZF22171.1 hypothetical protein H100_04928 [Trichophyton rubrum MR850]EZF41200.1 hypothetical protein H102_04914 [Trichophyton rubrum CBS 100081]EZF51859.1 hypothetical protein H103_04918 [Trichophyton rubrum CBS 288.86]EZF62446.1 hypothetical protein H104_04909 [Trichophyton rubrum CBS 289.86]EZF73084.1 hypothetical protein H105_04934 [Trichophyton soudanense CBS 452.61]EZF83765.1 hypothetical protein H110_04915 [Trichophy
MVFAKTFSNLVDYPLESLLILSCVLSTVYILSNEFVRYMARIKGFKGPPGLLMIGNLEQIQENAAEQYRQWSAEYGPVYQIQLGNIPIIVVNTAASAKTLFSQNSQALSSRPEFYTFHKVVSNTAGTTIGTSPYSESLKRRRKGAAAALNKPSVQSYVGHLDLETKDFIAELLKYGHAGNTAIDPMVMIQRLSLSLALTLNWGVRMASQEEELFKEITHVEDEISRFRSTTGNLQDYIPLLRLNPFNFGSKKAAEMRDRRDKYLQHLNAGLEERMAKNEHQPCIQANIMLDEDAKLNKEELTSISLTMLSGGLDTLTTLIAWSIALFSQRPDIQDKAADAIKEFYSQDQPLCDAVDDQKCEYIVALGKECLRYRTILHTWLHYVGHAGNGPRKETELTVCYRYFTVLRLALPRTSIKDITYEGKVIPKGTVFFLNAWACNMGQYTYFIHFHPICAVSSC